MLVQNRPCSDGVDFRNIIQLFNVTARSLLRSPFFDVVKATDDFYRSPVPFEIVYLQIRRESIMLPGSKSSTCIADTVFSNYDSFNLSFLTCRWLIPQTPHQQTCTRKPSPNRMWGDLIWITFSGSSLYYSLSITNKAFVIRLNRSVFRATVWKIKLCWV